MTSASSLPHTRMLDTKFVSECVYMHVCVNIHHLTWLQFISFDENFQESNTFLFLLAQSCVCSYFWQKTKEKLDIHIRNTNTTLPPPLPTHTHTFSVQHSSLKERKFQRLTNIEVIGRTGEELEENHRAIVLSIVSSFSFLFPWNQKQMIVQEAFISQCTWLLPSA